MDGTISNESGLEFKIGEVVESKDWDDNATEWDTIKGINFSNEENILRWIRRGDTIYDVIIPEDGKVKKVPGTFTPDGLFRANKVIVVNPVKLTEEVILDLYEKSNMPEKTYHDVLALLAIRGFEKACLKLIEDKVNENTIDVFIEDYINFENDIHDNQYGLYFKYKELLLKIKQEKYSKSSN